MKSQTVGEAPIASQETPATLPRLIVIADHAYVGDTERWLDIVARLARRLSTTSAAIQIRAHDLKGRDFLDAAQRVRAVVPEEVLLVLNGPLSIARSLGYGGIHVPEHRLTGELAGELAEKLAGELTEGLEGNPPPFVSAAVHSLDAVFRAQDIGATCVLYSPIFAPAWKSAESVGLKSLRSCAAKSPLPIHALGGITPSRIAPCLEAGAYGVAVLGGVLGAENPEAAVARYLKRLTSAPPNEPA